MELTHLDDSALDQLGITPRAIRHAIEAAIRDQAAGHVWTAPKSAVLPGDGRYAMATLAGSDKAGVAVVKSVMVCPDNPAKGLAGINGGIMVLDAQTGLLRAVLGANWITAKRTAGLSSVMAARLANPKSRSIGFVGTGVQAHAHLEAFADLFDLKEAMVFGRGQANIDKLSAALSARGIAAKTAATAQEAIVGMDLIVTSITLDYDVEPFLDARWMASGSFAAITDLGIPWVKEGMSALSPLFVDDAAQERQMERPLAPADLITSDLAGLVTTDSHGFDPDKRAAFVFRGIALGDLAIAALALEEAEKAR